MTLFLAIWGAALSTITVFWNFWKWWAESPRIVENVEALESFSVENDYRMIRFKLRNRGGKKTTIEDIFLYRHVTWSEFGVFSIFWRLGNEPGSIRSMGVSNRNTMRLPTVLDVNEVWEGHVPLEIFDPEDENEVRQVESNRRSIDPRNLKTLRYSIQCSHSKRRIRGRVKASDDLMRA